MKEGKQNEKSSMSMSKMRAIARKKEIEKMKRNARLTKIISISLIALISVGLVSLIGYSVYRSITKITPSSDYSAYLTEDGLIKDVTATDYLDLADYTNLTVSSSDIEYSDDSVDADIQALLEEHSELSTETDALITDSDKVNIDYVGTIDGVEFDGGNTQGAGTDLEIGSNLYIDDFEDQLIGHGIGDVVTVEATFPIDYENNPEVAGLDAVFEVVINGIYVSPEFTDAFVQENLSEYASTVDEYKEYLKQSKYEDNLTTWLEDYLMNNTTVLSYPKEYLNHLKSIKKYEDQSTYEYMREVYASIGSESPSSFEEYIDMSEAKYDAGLEEEVQDPAKKTMIFQAIFEKEGLSVTIDEYNTYFGDTTSEDFDSLVEQYGNGYVMQEIMYEKVLELVKGLITIE